MTNDRTSEAALGVRRGGPESGDGRSSRLPLEPRAAHGSSGGCALAVALSVIGVGGVLVPRASACDDVTVRDAAFDEPRDVHRLCVIGSRDDPEADAIVERLETWIEGPGARMNIELLRLAPDDPDVDWKKQCGIPSAPPSGPAVVLAGRQKATGNTFFIYYWVPAPNEEDLKTLLTSPARDAIRREVVRRVAVLLYVRGTDADAGRAEPPIQALQKAWADRGPLGISVVRVDRADAREKTLLSFIGVEPEGPDWITVVFGHGKFMPPLVGKEISEGELTKMVEAVAAKCTCLQTAGGMGVDIPMIWDQRDDGRVALMIPPSPDGDAASEDKEAARVAAIDLPELKLTLPTLPPRDGSDVSGRVLSRLLWVLVSLVAFAGIATLLIVRRKSRNRMLRVTASPGADELGIDCPNTECHHRNTPNAEYCGKCGAHLSEIGGKPLRARPA